MYFTRTKTVVFVDELRNSFNFKIFLKYKIQQNSNKIIEIMPDE